jgi:hypothetical protein
VPALELHINLLPCIAHLIANLDERIVTTNEKKNENNNESEKKKEWHGFLR